MSFASMEGAYRPDAPGRYPVCLEPGEYAWRVIDGQRLICMRQPVNEQALERGVWQSLVVLDVTTGRSHDDPPTWHWDGNILRPTLSPSIRTATRWWLDGKRVDVDLWHGYLTAGRFEGCRS